MKKMSFLFMALNIISYSFSQSEGPYKLRVGIDLPITVIGIGTSYIGLKYLRNKPRLDSAFVTSLHPKDVNKFDRGATRQTKNMSTQADLVRNASFLLPLFLCIDKTIRNDALKIGALYLETMAIMANVYTWGVGSTHRIRPFVYNPNSSIITKTSKGTTDSFFAGHPAAAAAATFFAAKVFSDYHPDSKLRYVFWPAAIIPPSIIAYYRYEGGKHFPTDILAGVSIGAFIGIVVPHLHKVNNKSNVQLYPTPGGIGLTYKFN